jgi:preprotein translocase subunit SecD
MRDSQQPILLSKKMIAAGDELVDASSGFDPQGGSPMVSVTLNAAAGKRMQTFTQDNVGNRMAVVFIERTPEIKVVDGKETITTKVKEEVISAARVNGVFGKNFQTTGLSSTAEASELALMLRAGSLAAPVVIVEERVVGPSQGQDNIDKGFRATLLGLLMVVVFVAFYYKVMGLIADFALVLNLILLVAVLSLLGATLTMPGVAGIVLTLGMAIDANVLICERVREELRNGSTPLASLRAGYDKAWATILDANVTHLIAALGLFSFGSGPIKGFAVTLGLGILTSMFTSVSITHAISDVVFGNRRNLKSLPV